MRTPVEISFQSLPYSAEIDELIRGEIDALEHLHPKLKSCRVVLETPHQVHIRVALPERAVSALRQHGGQRRQLQIAIQDAFADILARLGDGRAEPFILDPANEGEEHPPRCVSEPPPNG